MDRVVILGCGGSGKTFLAHQLTHLLGLPLTHLDSIYYDADWNPLPQNEFAQRQRELVARPRWLIEGNYAGTLPVRLAAADTVIFLDLPALICLAGIVQRRLRYRGGQRANGVYDRITWSLLRYVWRYRASMRPKVQRLIAQHGSHTHLIVLKSRRRMTQFVQRQHAERGPHP